MRPSEEAFRQVLECIAATSDDQETRTLASGILNEPQHRTDEQKAAVRELREELRTNEAPLHPNDEEWHAEHRRVQRIAAENRSDNQRIETRNEQRRRQGFDAFALDLVCLCHRELVGHCPAREKSAIGVLYLCGDVDAGELLVACDCGKLRAWERPCGFRREGPA